MPSKPKTRSTPLKTLLYIMPRKEFLRRLIRNFMFGMIVIIISFGMGIVGYHYFAKLEWIDAFVNAAMILSGMGPIAPLTTVGAKVFSGLYALFSGIVFLVVIAVTFAPLVHRLFRKFHMAEDKT